MSKSFRKISRKFHLWLSLIFCIPLIIISISGSVLVYAERIDEALLKDKVFRTQESVAKFPVRMKFNALQSEINSKFKEYAIMGWSIAQDASKTDKIRLFSQKLQKRIIIYLDAFSGEIKGAPMPRDEGFIGTINKLHAELFLGRGGRIFTGIVGLSALLIGISGFFIYKKFWQNLFSLRLDRAIYFMRGTHRLIGVASTPLMFAIAISGAWWELRAVTYKPLANPCGAVLQNFKTEQNSTVAASNGAVSMKAVQNLATLDEALAQIAVKFKEFRSTYIAFPLCPGGAFTVYGFEAGQNPLQSPYASRITISDIGEILKADFINDADFSDKLQDGFRRAHAGSYGAITKLIWFLAGLAPLFLSICGFYITLKNRNSKRRKL
ncbi:PepSY domain-containing protein [uncultured Campylobacter sp.]|uniref:PepSY-associated TM helix domain-containing protein n=1 Tax=uncultured Campylobacter sp. TaxID=218934 RepID=UPI0026127AD8|nr:PepSY-associated TM helix domain-containing protein [uncultured Campylobacter sp.]